MSNGKGLYLRFKEADFIKDEKYTMNPSRSREKVMGFMWEGELEVTTKDNLHFVFFFWHHYHNDTGGDWYPSKEMLDSIWCVKWIPQERSPTTELVDANWHKIHIDDRIYISKKGFFGNDKRCNQIKQSIKDGTWEQDDDIWLLI